MTYIRGLTICIQVNITQKHIMQLVCIYQNVKCIHQIIHIDVAVLYVVVFWLQIQLYTLTRGLSAYTARSSFKLFSIATNASKTRWTPNKKGNQRYTFTAVCPTYSLTVLSKRPFSLKQVTRQSNWSVATRDSVWLQSANNKIYHTKETIL